MLLGRPGCERAAQRLFALMQNDILNRHLALTLTDEIVRTLFPELVVPEGGDDETRGTNSVELAHLAEAATKETRDFGATLRHSGEGSEVADRVRAPATSKLGGDHDRGRLERERPLGATVEGGLDRERALDLGLSLSRERERVLEAALEAAMAQVEQLTARLQDE
jgi:hypothetical protein